MLKRKSSRKHVYDPFILKNTKVPLGKSGLKIIDWKSMDFIKREWEQAIKEIAAAKE